MRENNKNRWLTKKQLAGSLGLSQRTIQRWIAIKKIPFVRVSPQILRFDLSKVLDCLGKFEVENN